MIGAWRLAAIVAPALLPIAGAAQQRPVVSPVAARRAAFGMPHYIARTFTPEERSLLRRVYGVENPSRLYVTDSSEDALVKYDTQVKRCPTCYVNSYRLGFVSVRRKGESWDALERRVKSMRRTQFSSAARRRSRSIDDLDPDVRSDVRGMLADAHRAGFDLHVSATYRSPEREAMLMARRRGLTHTLTSLHSYGRAIDIVVGDGKLSHPATRARWIAFRRWVVGYKGHAFHILGAVDRTWDWPHVEMPSARIGFRTVDQAIGRAWACTSAVGKRPPCDFRPHLSPIVRRAPA